MKASTNQIVKLSGSIFVVMMLTLTTLSIINLKPEYRSPFSKASSGVQHYMYVFPEGGKISVYDIDNNQSLVNTITLPSNVSFIRGVGASVATHLLYISYGGNGGTDGTGSLLAYNLLTNQVVFDKHYTTGTDSFDITADGKTIYMPDGDFTNDGIWRILDASTGNVLSSIDTGGLLPHNTIVGPSQKKVYLGGRQSNYLYVASTATNQIIQKIGPVKSGVRPFTVNSSETLAYIITSGYLGFQVGNITTGQILYTVPINGFTTNTANYVAPSHGISLSPDEKEVYVSDWPNSHVHVFDVSSLPTAAPKQVADIAVHSMVGNDLPCVKTCEKEGWVMHSRDGRYVYVGDSGDVIDTTTRKSVAFLQPLANTRKFIEIDWQNNIPIAASSRQSEGTISGMILPTTTTLITPTVAPTSIIKTPTPIIVTHSAIPTMTSVQSTVKSTQSLTNLTSTVTTTQSKILQPTTSTLQNTTSTNSVQTMRPTSTSSVSNPQSTSFVSVKVTDGNNTSISNAKVILDTGVNYTTDSNGITQVPLGSKLSSVNVNGTNVPINLLIQGTSAYTLIINPQRATALGVSEIDANALLVNYLLYTFIIIASLTLIGVLLFFYKKKVWIFAESNKTTNTEITN